MTSLTPANCPKNLLTPPQSDYRSGGDCGVRGWVSAEDENLHQLQRVTIDVNVTCYYIVFLINTHIMNQRTHVQSLIPGDVHGSWTGTVFSKA